MSRAFLRVGAMGAMVATALSSGAHASQIVASDCSFGFKDTYNPGDAVCVTGDADVKPPGQLFPAGYVHVLPAGHENPLADVTGAPNYVQGASLGGAFYDEYVWLPPLKPGKYDLVLDEYPFKSFGAEDTRLNNAFSVTDAPLVYTVDVMAIKGAAQKGLEAARAMRNMLRALAVLDTLSTAADWAYALAPFGLAGVAAGLAIGLGAVCYATNTDCPTSYNSAVLAIGGKYISGQADALEAHYDALVKDPPDPNFNVMVPLDMAGTLALGGPLPPLAGHDVPRRYAAIGQLLAVQAAAYQALLPTVEKLQGAQSAKSHSGIYMQAIKTKAYAKLALDAGTALSAEIDGLEAALKKEGVLDATEDVRPIVDDILKNGFSAEVTAGLRSFGLGDADIALAKSELAGYTIPDAIGYKPLLAAARANHDELKAALTDLIAQAEAMRAENEKYALWPGPRVTLTASATGQVGTELTLTAAATHFDQGAKLTYAWDTDMDGKLDNGTAKTQPYTPSVPGRMLVAVQVSDGKLSDVAHAVIDVAEVNAPPELVKLAPADAAPFAAVDEEVKLHAEATDADNDPVTIKWLVDGQEQATGQDFTFKMPDEEPHTVVVVGADDDVYSADARATFIVRARKWESIINGSGGAGGSGGSAGGAAGAGGASGGSGGAEGGSGGSGGVSASSSGSGGAGESDSDSGCSCRLVGGGSSNAAWLAALLLAAARRRRRQAP